VPANNLEVGKTVGDYKIIALLGHGGMGKIFKVRDLISDHVDAMKSLLSYGDGDLEAERKPETRSLHSGRTAASTSRRLTYLNRSSARM
jgi:serine/threonine protein kinase